MEQICRKLGFAHFEVVEANGQSGGLVLFWSVDVDISLNWKSSNVICGTVNLGVPNLAWHFYGCYGPCRYSEKRTFWMDLQSLVNADSLPWMIFGDLNEIVDGSEKLGGRDIRGKKLFLKQFMQNSGGVDLGYIGKKFTWVRKLDGVVVLKERLDRVVAGCEWLQKFHQATVTPLAAEESDHTPLLIQTNGEKERYNRPFRFLKAWTSDSTSHQVVHYAWNWSCNSGRSATIFQKLSSTAKAFRVWNKTHFGYAHQRIANLEEELQKLQEGVDAQFPNQIHLGKQEEILNQLRIQRTRLESIYRQKSRECWLKEGDRNSKFFFASIMIRRRRNRIWAVKEGDDWISERYGIEEYFLKHFKELFKSEEPVTCDILDDLIAPCVSAVENEDLVRIPTPEEIKHTVWDMHPLKSPGPDGFSGIFFRNYWNIVGGQVVEFVQGCFCSHSIPKLANRTFIVLIPKAKQACNFNHFRPISLSNFIYKVVSKIITNRLKGVMDRIISPNQGAFIKGRWIAENTIIAQEVVHKVRKHKGRQGLMVIKIDLSKAYDRLEWTFLNSVLQGWGFSVEFQRLILSCVQSVQYSLLLNGSLSKSFIPSRGIRQGDPVSPFLFILCAEVLSRLLFREEECGNLDGIKLGRGAPTISHLMYADDLLIMCRADEKNASTIKRILELYGAWSGQQPNFEKSQILFSPKTDRSSKQLVKEILGFKEMSTSAIYLGNNLVFSRRKTEDLARFKDRVQARLEGWQSRLLSRAGRLTLIKSVVQAMPVYSMSTFQFPTSICEDLDSLARRFWWGKSMESSHYLALKSWKEICQPKDCGGLGCRLFKEANLALLAKLGWSMASNDNKLWVNLLKAKYLRGESFFAHTVKPGASFVWRGILNTREVIRSGACFKLGNGLSINPWTDPWIPWVDGFKASTREGVDGRFWSCVADLRDGLEGGWNYTLLNEICDSAMVEAISKIEWPQQYCVDKLVWLPDVRGRFSVKSCYLQANLQRFTGRNEAVWGRLWRAKLHERLKLHLWRILAQVLPTRDILSRRFPVMDLDCLLCGQNTESCFHIFKECSFSRALIFGSKWGHLLDCWRVDDVTQMISTCLSPEPLLLTGGVQKDWFLIFFASFLYTIWSCRNDCLFGRIVNLSGSIKYFEQLVDEFSQPLKVDVESSCSPGEPRPVIWSCPPTGWIKVNVDASFKQGEAAGAFIVRDDHARVLMIQSKLFRCASPYAAEVNAFEWASEVAEVGGWRNVSWSLDAKVVVDEVLSTEDPGGWETRVQLLNIKRRFQRRDWILSWHPRSANLVADAIAKFTFSNNSSLFFDAFSLDEIPVVIATKIADDVAVAV